MSHTSISVAIGVNIFIGIIIAARSQAGDVSSHWLFVPLLVALVLTVVAFQWTRPADIGIGQVKHER